MATSHAALSFVTNIWKSILTLALEKRNWLRERRGGWKNRHQEVLKSQQVSPRDQHPFRLA